MALMAGSVVAMALVLEYPYHHTCVRNIPLAWAWLQVQQLKLSLNEAWAAMQRQCNAWAWQSWHCNATINANPNGNTNGKRNASPMAMPTALPLALGLAGTFLCCDV